MMRAAMPVRGWQFGSYPRPHDRTLRYNERRCNASFLLIDDAMVVRVHADNIEQQIAVLNTIDRVEFCQRGDTAGNNSADRTRHVGIV